MCRIALNGEMMMIMMLRLMMIVPKIFTYWIIGKVALHKKEMEMNVKITSQSSDIDTILK